MNIAVPVATTAHYWILVVSRGSAIIMLIRHGAQFNVPRTALIAMVTQPTGVKSVTLRPVVKILVIVLHS